MFCSFASMTAPSSLAATNTQTFGSIGARRTGRPRQQPQAAQRQRIADIHPADHRARAPRRAGRRNAASGSAQKPTAIAATATMMHACTTCGRPVPAAAERRGRRLRVLTRRRPHARHAAERALDDAHRRCGVDDAEIRGHRRETAPARRQPEQRRRARPPRPSTRRGRLLNAPASSSIAPTAASTMKKPDSHRSTLCEMSDQLKRPTRNGFSTPDAWNTARQLRLTMRTRRRYSTRIPPAVSS